MMLVIVIFQIQINLVRNITVQCQFVKYQIIYIAVAQHIDNRTVIKCCVQLIVAKVSNTIAKLHFSIIERNTIVVSVCTEVTERVVEYKRAVRIACGVVVTVCYCRLVNLYSAVRTSTANFKFCVSVEVNLIVNKN